MFMGNSREKGCSALALSALTAWQIFHLVVLMASGEDDFTDGHWFWDQVPVVQGPTVTTAKVQTYSGLAVRCWIFPPPHCQPLVGSVLATSHVYVWEIGNKPKAQEYVMVLHCLLNCAQLFATPWTVAHQAPLSMGILQARILEWVAISCTTSLKNNAATMLCASLDGRGVWERMDTCVCMAESLHLKISHHCYLAIPQYKKIKLKKKCS